LFGGGFEIVDDPLGENVGIWEVVEFVQAFRPDDARNA